MKKLLLAGVAGVALAAAGSADAADLTRKPVYKALPVAAPAPVFSWSGCYIGAHVGGGWGHKDFDDPMTPNTPGATSVAVLPVVSIPDGFSPGSFFIGNTDPETLRVDISGFLGGGQIGCDYQFTPNWVIGIEGEGSGSGIRGSAIDPFFSFNKTFHAKTDWLASVTARVGWTWDRWMLYGKGGVAWARDKYHVDEIKPGIEFYYDTSETRAGWTAGVGLAWAFWQNWSAFLEYDFYGFGHRDVFFQCTTDSGPCGRDGPVTVKQDINAIKFGVNYRFGWGKAPTPVVAKY